MRCTRSQIIICLLLSTGIASCCHRETYQCIDSPPPVAFVGFDSLDLKTIEIRYLQRGGANRTVLDSTTVYPGDGYPIGSDSMVYPGIIRTDTTDIELYLPALAREYTIADLRKEIKGSRTVKICFNEKIDFACNNYYTSYSLNGISDTLMPAYGPAIPIVN